MGRRTLIHERSILLIPTSAASRFVDAGSSSGIPAAVGKPTTYRVRRGDTLSSIGRRYDTTAKSIAEANGIPLHGLLGLGQSLTVVPGVRNPSVARRIALGESTKSDSVGQLQHTIRRGDTLWRIAHLYQTSINALCALNGISQNTILRPGVTLTVGYR
jgi:LysM repeat protein